ncbi:protein adenylyltransferase SelO, mitochondrial-like [Dysidea avara]|uniref:protein adenylyltransferase SelO, mitochondrial-like n=1 Tax=Dysidea avara TaxID=196820 RepID=UPI003321CAD5
MRSVVHSLIKLQSKLQSVVGRRYMATLEKLNVDNLALRSLPLDKEERISPRIVHGACFSRVKPTSVDGPVLVAHSQPALDLLDVHPDEVQRKDFAEYFSGNRIIPGAEPAAHCYCGHQFGSFSGQLGDGATMYLCEVVNKDGERWELQFKGAGQTPYSRHADGRKVLRSSVREFLCSEAIHFLGIPTTRAGTCVTSDTRVVRDIHYDGHPIEERVTIITRIAPTFLRFGSFEIFKARDSMTGRIGPSVGRTDILHQLLDYTTSTFYPEIHSAHQNDREARTTEFFKEVCRRTARLVALWQSVGFCHGVLNTDNMSIVGLTIDYGPFGFMDRYNPDHICNGSDNGGRYTYQKQPSICQWNLQKLAEALSPCMSTDNAAEGIKVYKAEFKKIYLSKMRSKLGLVREQSEDDSDLIESFLDTMHKTGCDFTNGFLCLSNVTIPHDGANEKEAEQAVDGLLRECATAKEMATSSKAAVPVEHLRMLLEQHPQLLASFGMTVDMIKQEIEKATAIEKLKDVSNEEKEANDRGHWMEWIKLYQDRLKKEIKDDSASIAEANKRRLQVMKESNPRFILRNYIAQNAIEKAEKGDFTEVRRVLKLLESPYSEASLETVGTSGGSSSSSGANVMELYCSRPPQWAHSLVVT